MTSAVLHPSTGFNTTSTAAAAAAAAAAVTPPPSDSDQPSSPDKVVCAEPATSLTSTSSSGSGSGSTSSVNAIEVTKKKSRRRRTSDTLLAILKMLSSSSRDNVSKEAAVKIVETAAQQKTDEAMPAMPKAASVSGRDRFEEMREQQLLEAKASAGPVHHAPAGESPDNHSSSLNPQQQQQPQAVASAPSSGGGRPTKRSANDFRFGKTIGEGSFSTVYLAKDIHTGKECAIKVCDKQLILREKKQDYIKREREVMNVMSGCPGFVNLYCTFQDSTRLYFVMTYAKGGDLLPHINKVGSFDRDCTRFYAAELVLAMENMHKRGVIHRDLKPENVLFDAKMHTLIADFGSSKMVEPTHTNDAATATTDAPAESSADSRFKRKNSFVGTAQYVSPEILKGQPSTAAVDLWAFGCIIYQMVSGLPPFRGATEYLIFQSILKQELSFPDGFDADARDLVERLLVLDPCSRIGAKDRNRYDSIRSHPFFAGIDWERVHEQDPPKIYPYLPGLEDGRADAAVYRVPDHLEPGLGEKQLTRLLCLDLGTVQGTEEAETDTVDRKSLEPKSIANVSDEERRLRLEKQKTEKWDAFAEGELILKQGFVNKRKGLFARKRMLLLTTGPRLIYIDPAQMVKKGEIPWSEDLRVEPKNFKIFFVHTPNRTYYLEDPDGFALKWCEAIKDVRRFTYDGELSSAAAAISMSNG